MCWVNVTYLGTHPFGWNLNPTETLTGVSWPDGWRWRLRWILEPALINRPEFSGKRSAFLPTAYSFKNRPTGSASGSSTRFVVAWCTTLNPESGFVSSAERYMSSLTVGY